MFFASQVALPLARLLLWKTVLVCLALILSVMQAVAQSDWRDEVGTFRVGIMTGDDALGVVRRAELFREALNVHLDVPVELVAFGDLPTLIDAHVSGRIEYAVHTALSFTIANAACKCLEPLVVPTFDGGGKGVHAVMIAKGGGLSEISQLGAKTLGHFGKDDVLTWQIAVASLLQEGVDLDKENVVDKQLSNLEEGREALDENRIAALLGWSTLVGDVGQGFSHGTLTEFMKSGDTAIGEYRIIWQSGLVPLGPHALRRNLALEAKTLVQSFLVNLAKENPAAYDAISPLHAGGFRPIQNSDYRVLREIIEQQPKAANSVATDQ